MQEQVDYTHQPYVVSDSVDCYFQYLLLSFGISIFFFLGTRRYYERGIQISNPLALWDEFKDAMSEDILWNVQRDNPELEMSAAINNLGVKN